MPVITVRSRIRDYAAYIETEPGFIGGFQRSGSRCYVVDENVWRLYRRSALAPLERSPVIVQPIKEELKTLESVGSLYDRLAELSAKRNLTLIAVGGGILQDIAGFAASTLYRGINWAFVPTTLLAQADSCIGGKTSLNYRHYKNLVGTFYPPTAIHIWPGFLATLERPDFYSGVGEVVKLHLLGGESGAEALAGLMPGIEQRDEAALTAAVESSLRIKLGYISEDEFDRGRRNLLNFGHCFGHALETTSGFALPHGQAVLAGIALANIAARNRGLLAPGREAELAQRLLMPNLVTAVAPASLAADAVVDAMKKDKKRTGEDLALVVLKDGYEAARLDDFKPEEAAAALAEFAGRLAATGKPK